jgi:outer membrane protein insertion porin family
LKLEEQNRNQLQFGAGYSQYEGTFLQFAFSTSNFMGRGETLSTSVLTGARYKDYQVSFTEPFLFDRPITGGINVFNRNIVYPFQFTQETSGGNIMFGMPVGTVFSRLYVRYSLENVAIKDLNEAFYDTETIRRLPYLADALLIRPDGTRAGRRVISKITPSWVYNTVDNPIFPSAGTRITASIDLAGVGGNTNYYKPTLELIRYFQHTRRTSFGIRTQFEYAQPIGGTEVLPFFERLVLGGEYSVRGYDVRSIGPYDTDTGLVLGGNKSFLFNGEYLIQVAGPVRLVLFYDAGQVRDEGQKFRMSEFVASTGAEVRFFMPVLNVPFRLIFARNINHEGILNNNLEPEKKVRFRFAVGSTF